MADITIRRARLDDIPQLITLRTAFFLTYQNLDKYLNQDWPKKSGKRFFRKRITKEEWICFVAETENTLVGFLTGTIKPLKPYRPIKTAELESIYLQEKYRGKNIGEKLLKVFFAWSKKHHAQQIVVYAYAGDLKAIRFYLKNGFATDTVGLKIAVK